MLHWLDFHIRSSFKKHTHLLRCIVGIVLEDDDSLEDVQIDFTDIVTWFPRGSLRETNWRNRVDVLRIHDYRKIELQYSYI